MAEWTNNGKNRPTFIQDRCIQGHLQTYYVNEYVKFIPRSISQLILKISIGVHICKALALPQLLP